AVVAIGLISPILGALADYAAIKKRLLALFLLTGVAATTGLFFVQAGDWVPALALFMLVNVGVAGSFVFYDALLPHIAREGELDRVSTTAFALGYLGGGLLLALNVAWITWPGAFGLGPAVDGGPEGATLP